MRGWSESEGISYQTTTLKITNIHLNYWKRFTWKGCEDEINLKGYLFKHQYSCMQFQGLPKKNYTCKELRMKWIWKNIVPSIQECKSCWEF